MTSDLPAAGRPIRMMTSNVFFSIQRSSSEVFGPEVKPNYMYGNIFCKHSLEREEQIESQ